MKAKVLILAVMLTLIFSNVFAQEKTKKEIREGTKLEKQKQVKDMIEAKTFDFIGKTVIPTGYKTVNLTTTENFVKFQPDKIESYLPFYGNAYSGVGYGGDEGLNFTGKPEDFTITKRKNNFLCNAVVKGERDTYRLSLTVSFNGTASLTITSNNRSTISYSGDIKAPETKDKRE